MVETEATVSEVESVHLLLVFPDKAVEVDSGSASPACDNPFRVVEEEGVTYCGRSTPGGEVGHNHCHYVALWSLGRGLGETAEAELGAAERRSQDRRRQRIFCYFCPGGCRRSQLEHSILPPWMIAEVGGG